jgi:arsenical pump membrane protein
MSVLAAVLLGAGIVVMFVRPGGAPVWVGLVDDCGNRTGIDGNPLAPRSRAQGDEHHDSPDSSALRRGLPIIGFVLIGFTAGDALGVPAWAVAAVAVVWATVLTKRIPWRVVPYEAMLVVVGLGVLVAGAVPHLGLAELLHGGGIAGRLRAFGFGVIGSNASNNLPAVLAGSASIQHTAQVWPLLIGTNIGPVLVITGALSGLLWRDTAKRFDVEVSARRYSAVGLRVGLPALLAAGVLVVLL